MDGGERSDGASDGVRGSLLELRVAGMARSVRKTSVGKMLQRGKTIKLRAEELVATG